MNRRRNSYSSGNSFSKNIKDFIIPIIGFILIIALFYSCFKKSPDPKPEKENQNGIIITKDADSTAKIIYLNGTKKELSEGDKLFKSEKITVGTGRVKLTSEKGEFNLNKLGELTYLENGNFSFYSGEIWIDSTSDFELDMRFAKLKISSGSHLSLSQNEVNSSINVVSGTVEVTNLKGKGTVLSSMEKLDVARSDASDEKIDFSIKKLPLDDYFLKSDWFVLNKGPEYIKKEEKTSSTGKTEDNKDFSKGNISTGKSKYLTFSNLIDESNVSSSNISVSGVYDTEEVAKIELNGNIAVLNSETGTFKIDSVSVSSKENDLVFKVFDADENLKEKFVYTVYNDAGTNQITTGGENSGNVFSADGTKFSFTAPASSGTYTTSEGFVTIRGTVSASNIDKVTVNNFKLNSFNGKTWRYHASVDYGNLSNGTNVYEVKYYSGANLVYKNYFTIIKKDGINSSTKVKDSSESVNLESNSSTPISY